MKLTTAMSSFYVVSIAAAVLFACLILWLIVRARKPARTGGVIPGEKGTGGWFSALRERFSVLFNAIGYLSTRREWRYQVPWLLLLGETNSGKTSIAASAGAPRREILSKSEERLALPGTRWWFFERGVLVDLERTASPNGTSLEQRAAWGSVVRGLFDHRPERPIDGIVLTLSARTLLTGSAADLQRLAEQNYTMLVELQRRFEFTFPVYVVVTQCDAVEGFDAFWSIQDPVRRREMVGWSNPYSLDSAFLKGWVDEAFDHVGKGLKQLQLEAASGAVASPQEVDRYFLFPQRMRDLSKPLEVVLEGMFRPSAYHANFFFRGIYFSGAVNGGGIALPKPRNDVAFLDALFEEKAFAEVNLARINRQSLLSRQQVIRRIQLGSIVGFALLCLWLGFSAKELNRQVNTTIIALKMVKSGQAAVENGCASKESVYALLELVSNIKTEFDYVSIPASFVDHRHANAASDYVAHAAFEQVIFPGLRCRLEEKARDVLLSDIEVPDSDLRAPDAADKARDSFIAQVQELETFEKNLAIYQEIVLPHPKDRADYLLDQLDSLLQYLYGSPLPSSVKGRNGVHRDALADVEEHTPVNLPDNMRSHAMASILHQAEQTQQDLSKRLVQGGDDLRALDAGEPQVLVHVKALLSWVGWAQSEWLAAGNVSNPCLTVEKPLRPLLTSLRDRYGYGKEVMEAAELFSNDRCYLPTVRRLESIAIAPHGLLFVRTADGVVIAPPFKAELDNLESLTKLQFMQLTPQSRFTCRNPLRGWDTGKLAQANSALREFEQWVASQESEKNSGVPRTMAVMLARRQIEALTNDWLYGAQIPFGLGAINDASVSPIATMDEQLRQQSADFARVLDPLVLTIHVLRQRGFEASAARIAQCARDFSTDSLHTIDALAAASRLYVPNFAASNDSSPDSLLLTGMGSDAEAKDYLKRQLQRGQVLSGYASPFVSFLLNTEGVDDAHLSNREATLYWSNTIGELNRYIQFKEPNGQVAHLDQFFAKELAGLTVSKCGTQLAAYQPLPYGNDLFSAQRLSLLQQVNGRCSRGRESAFHSSYLSLAREFNQSLAGRFPFGPDPQRDAPLGVVKKFVQSYMAQREMLRAEMKAMKGDRWSEAAAFLDSLDTVANFFSTNLAAGESGQPLRIKIGFRAYADSSPGSEQIVNWGFHSGNDVALYPNGAQELPWQFGRPVALELKWAAQSRQTPVSDLNQHHLSVEGATAKFNVDGAWALLKLLHAHAARTLPAQELPDPTTRLLEFEVPVVEKEANEQKTSRMYLSLQLLGTDPQSGKAAPLRLPDQFPIYAPMVW